MTRVTLDQLTKIYPGASAPAVDALSLDIPDGDLVAFLGPSGCGKTTLLKLITGLLKPERGDIAFDGESILPVPAEKRGAVMVFQNHLLFPYMTIEQNVGFGLKMRGEKQNTIRRKVKSMLDLVHLPDVEQRRPSQLSGGQQQRVALARALITEPRVLLLDEPLSNLDAHLRDEMRTLILDIQHKLGVTTVFVTHDQEEAVLLADNIALMFDGELVQYGTPAEFYQRPVSGRVARFFGGVNFVPARREGPEAHTPLGTLALDVPAANQTEGDVVLTIRPEQVQLAAQGEDPNCLQGTVAARIYVGTYTRYKVRVGEHELEAIRSAETQGVFQEGDPVTLYLPPDQLWPMPQGGGAGPA